MTSDINHSSNTMYDNAIGRWDYRQIQYIPCHKAFITSLQKKTLFCNHTLTRYTNAKNYIMMHYFILALKTRPKSYEISCLKNKYLKLY